MTDIEGFLDDLGKEPDAHEMGEDPFDLFLKEHHMQMNPFSDRIADDRMFVNKDKEACSRIVRSIKHNQSSITLLIGPTGSGKSETADFIMRNLQEEYIFWYNQIYEQTSMQLAFSILVDLDPECRDELSKKNREKIIGTFKKVLSALALNDDKLFCIFDQGEHFSQDAFKLVINLTNPHHEESRAFSALILAVPRFERRLERWMEGYDTGLRRALIREYTRPFSLPQRVEYIMRRVAVSKGTDYTKLIRSRDFAPFEGDAISLLVEESDGHPDTLNDLCYTSLELAAEESPKSMVTESIAKEAWEKYPNKSLHRSILKWYIEKELY